MEKRKSKSLIVIICVLALLLTTVVGTLAWLTDKEEVKNTFTVGKIDLELKESPVDENGKKTDGTGAEKYQLIPGRTIDKDPTVTVKGGSEECYVRMLVNVENYDKLKTAMAKAKVNKYGTENLSVVDGDMVRLDLLVNGWDENVWKFERFDKNTFSYEFRYVGTVAESASDTGLAPLFTTVTIPGTLNNDEMKLLEDVSITVTAQAIQAEGFEASGTVTAEQAAWNAFAEQMAVNAPMNP